MYSKQFIKPPGGQFLNLLVDSFAARPHLIFIEKPPIKATKKLLYSIGKKKPKFFLE